MDVGFVFASVGRRKCGRLDLLAAMVPYLIYLKDPLCSIHASLSRNGTSHGIATSYLITWYAAPSPTMNSSLTTALEMAEGGMVVMPLMKVWDSTYKYHRYHSSDDAICRILSQSKFISPFVLLTIEGALQRYVRRPFADGGCIIIIIIQGLIS